ncbi:MAG: carbamoyl-phosphate synthase small subunit [Phycisphaerales bacterium]|nr:carbamoyl-phosphate synthase small subunit [Phycisphaerales bacterium]
MPHLATHSAPAHRPARLVLADGTVFCGMAFGAPSAARIEVGEVVFNTAMSGYQEALTDPSYTGQILTLTATQVGNYGITLEDIESARPTVSGFVTRELSRIWSNQRSVEDLSGWLARFGIPAIHEIDTRALVRRLRNTGSMNGVICDDSSRSADELTALVRSTASMAGRDIARSVSPRSQSRWDESLGEWAPRADNCMRIARKTLTVVAIDCGAKRNIYRNLAQRNCVVRVVPHDASVESIRALNADGLFISNGPGDPAAVESTVQTLRQIAGELPTFGICLGHQLLALALGATTYKLKFGHRGSNQPVRNLLSGRIEITSQNHGFCVDELTLRAAGGEPTHVHLNDQTIAGFRHRTKPIFSVQYHPEASPGPHDSDYLFDCFVELMETRVPLSEETMRIAQTRSALHARGELAGR